MARRLALEGGRAGGVDRRTLPEAVHFREHVGAGGGGSEHGNRKQDGGERADATQPNFGGFDIGVIGRFVPRITVRRPPHSARLSGGWCASVSSPRRPSVISYSIDFGAIAHVE